MNSKVFQYLLGCLFFLGVFIQQVFANEDAAGKFFIVHVSADVVSDIADINKRMISLNDEKSLIKFLKKNFNQPGNGYLLIGERKDNNEMTFRFYFLNSKTSSVVNTTAVMAGKDLEIPVIQKTTDFKNVFTDSLIIFDSLFLKLRLKDVDYPAEGYFLLYNSSEGNNLEKSELKNHHDTLVVTRENFTPALNGFVKVSLRNTGDVESNLMVFHFRFASPGEQAELISTITAYKNLLPGCKNREIKAFTLAVIKNIYGNYFTPNIESFLLNHQLTVNN